MEVLVMIGARAGQIRDINPFYARQMLRDGRAIDPNAPIAEVPAGFADGGVVELLAPVMIGEIVPSESLAFKHKHKGKR